MKAVQFLTRFFNCKSDNELFSIIFYNYQEEYYHQVNPLTLLPCLRDICKNQQVYFERFLEPNENIHNVITECYPRAEDGTVQWDNPQYVMLDDLEVGECECSQKTTQRLVYGDDEVENHF